MTRVRKRQPKRLRALHQVVAAVSDHECVRPLCDCKIHHFATGSAADRHPTDRPAAITKANAARTQTLFDIKRELPRPHFLWQVANTSQHPVFPRFQIPHVGEEQRSGQGVVNASLRTVRVGVHTNEGNLMPDRGTQDTSSRIVLGYLFD